MAITYLEYVNSVLRRLNEVEATTIVGSRGVVKHAADAVNDAVRKIMLQEKEWPFNYSAITQVVTSGIAEYSYTASTIDWQSFWIEMPENITNTDFTANITSWTSVSTGTGSAAWNAAGNGRLRLAGGAAGVGAAEQSITTIVGRPYTLKVKTYGGTITLRIGTATSGTQILNDAAIAQSNSDRGEWYQVTFIPTTTTTFIGFRNTANNNKDVDYVSCKEQIATIKLQYIDYDEYLSRFLETENDRSYSELQRPGYVYSRPDYKYGLAPIPDIEYTIHFDGFVYPVDMVADADTTTIPDIYKQVITDGAMVYMYRFKESVDQAGEIKTDFNDGIRRMRTQLINKKVRMIGTEYGINYAKPFRFNNITGFTNV